MGVQGVSNQLTVKSRPIPGDVRQRIRKAMERQAGEEADRLSITVDDGTVTLRGTVQSWTDFEDVERAVWAASGVTRVKNNLQVKRTAYA